MKNKFTKFTLVVLVFALVAMKQGSSQNLVPNPGFETITSCPTIFNDSIGFCPPWRDANAGGGLAYSLTCPPPLNVPPRSGNGCGGLFHKLAAPNHRGFIEVPLTSTLILGQQYCVSYWLRLDGTTQWAVNRSGAYFSNTFIFVNDYLPLPYTPQVEHPSAFYLTDTIGWMQVAGTFTAAGGETHMIIGNFYNDSQTGLQVINASGLQGSFYYIDDVSVTAVGAPCFVGMEENLVNNNAIQIAPNPATNFLTIQLPAETKASEIKLLNLTGQLIKEAAINKTAGNEITFDVSSCPSGLYTLSVITNEGVVNKKVMVVK